MSPVANVMSRIASIENSMASVLGTDMSRPLGAGGSPITAGASTSAGVAAALGSTTSIGASGADQDDFAKLLDQLTSASSTAAKPGAVSTPPVADKPLSAGPGTPTGEDLVAQARTYLGVPYVWGGASASGLDCSGLVQLSLKNLGVDITRTARQQMREGEAVASLADAKPGDLIVFNGGTHVGIYTGDGMMIDAPKPGRTVTEREVYETPTAIRRVLSGASAVTASKTAVSLDATTAAIESARAQSEVGAGRAAHSGFFAVAESQRMALALFTGTSGGVA